MTGGASTGSRPGSGRLPALAAMLALLIGLAAALALTVPWRTLELPVPGGSVATAPARDFTVAEQAREDTYHAQLRPPAYVSLVGGLAVAAVLGLTPLGARLARLAARPLGGGWLWQVVVGGLVLLLLGRLAVLPLDARVEQVRRAYGLSTRDWPSWAGDIAKGFALSAGLTLLILVAVVALGRMLPRWWWAPAAVGGALLVAVVSFAYPLAVEPVFNRFTPMAEGPLRTSLLALARADGLDVEDVLVADASRRTSTLNAYVSGLAGSRRIVVYDTLLRRGSPAEVRLIVAHELGHAKRGDVPYGTLLGAFGVAAGVCALHLLVTSAPLLRRAGAAGPGDPATLALLLVAISVMGLISTPVQSLVSRRIEARADVHALDLTREPAGYARLQRRLAVANLSDLDPPLPTYLAFATHPTAPERIALARSWAEAHGQPPPADLAP